MLDKLISRLSDLILIMHTSVVVLNATGMLK